MKKFKIILIMFIVMLFIPAVYAGEAYVDSIVVDAKINYDGSMTVKETITWDIIDDLNGVYRDILIKNPSNELNSASWMEITGVIVEGVPFTYSSKTLQNGDSGKYNINNIEGGKQLKIFTPSSDEYKTTEITYTLYDVIVEYKDVAELYWNFIGSGWDYGINDICIRISLPSEDKNLKIFAHGPLNGCSTIMNNDEVVLDVNNLRSGEQVDARILLDNTIINASKLVKENKLESILEEEAVLAIEANKRREAAKKCFYGSIILVVTALIIPILIYINVHKKAVKPKFKGKYYRELPEDYGPATMNKLLYPVNGTVSSLDMLATLLDLVRKKYVKIEPVFKNESKKSKGKPRDYKLILVNKDIGTLNEVEQHFIQNLIFVDVEEITLKDLGKKNSKNMKAQKTAYESYTKWSEIIEKNAKDNELLKKEKVKVGKNVLKSLVSLLLIIPVITYGVIVNFEDIIVIGMVGIFFVIFELVSIFIGLVDLNIRTPKGVEHKAMWKAFRKFLLDFSKLDERDYKAIAIWEHYLVYATALGISKKVIKELKVVFPTEFEENSNMLSTYATISLLSDSNAFSSFSDSFTSAATTAFSTPSSSTGSGGGFSGGAGGRRRWRRRRRFLAEARRRGL